MNQNQNERRKYPRYGTEVEVYFQISYDIHTKIDYQHIDTEKEETERKKHHAVSKNVSAEGLCLQSPEELNKGDLLKMDVYVPGKGAPVLMKGEVRWSHEISLNNKEKYFDTGIKIISVEDHSVTDTIKVDKENNVIWSNVLDAIFGSFGKISKENRKK